MKDKLKQNTKKLKKPYIKPELKQVPLKPEEAVLGFCKIKDSRGPGLGTCSRPSGCYTLGS